LQTNLTPDQIAELAAFAETLADAAGKVIMPYFRKPLHVDDKAGAGHRFDPVTEADREAERVIRAMIKQKYPHHAVIGEEHPYDDGNSGKAGPKLTWVLDPIDGTRAFISGLPLWGTLIALNDGHQPVIGVIDQPFTGERFIGTPLGSHLGGEKLKTRACAGLAQATLSTTDPDLLGEGAERSAYRKVENKVRLRRYGYDCYAYAMLAHGYIDLVIEAGLKTFDVQALIPVIQGAGGIVTNWRGGPAFEGGQIIAAGDARVHAEALALLAEAAS
jgi:histidinol phosphatase-like enzyme (inositol monophosphatase family)